MRYLRIARSRFDLGVIALLFFAVTQAHVSIQPALARDVVDATGSKVTLTDRPRRIVTLAPSLGELAADLAGEQIHRIVGVSEFTDYPPALKRVETIGPYFKFNLEKVVALKPDLVLATLDGSPKDQVTHLRELGVPVVVVATGNFKEVMESITLIAEAMGEAQGGRQLVSQLQRGISRIRERTRDLPKRRVMLQVGDEPLVVVGRKTFLHEALEAVGGINVYGDAVNHYPRPSLEDVIRRDPELIVILALNDDLKSFELMARRWQAFSKMKAVKDRRVQVVRSDPILRPSIRLLEGLAVLERAIHGKK